MVDQLCQAYHWPLEEAMSRTLPQIILLNHAASVNCERSKRRSERAGKKKQEQKQTDPVVFNGKRLSELTSDEMAAYYANWG